MTLGSNQRRKSSLFGSAVRVRHSLDGVSAIFEIHDGDAGDFTDATPQVFVTRGHDVTLVLRHSLRDAVVGVRALVQARQTLESGVLGYPESDFEFGSQFFDFCHDAVGDIRNAFGVKTVHHRLPNVQLVLNRKVDEIRVNQDVEGRTEIGVVCEEHGGSGLRQRLNFHPRTSRFLTIGIFVPLFPPPAFFGSVFFLDSDICEFQHFLHLPEFLLLNFTHCFSRCLSVLKLFVLFSMRG